MYHIKVKDNVKIAVCDLNPVCKNVIVMIHGWPLSGRIFEYQKRVLADRGFRVITLDLRGLGRSDAVFDGYGYDSLTDDIYRAIRTLNLTSFILAGFSMGGAIALRYMRLFRGYGVKKLVLLAAAAPKYTQDETFPFGVTMESVDELIYQAKTDRAQLAEDFSRRLLASPHSDAIKRWFASIALESSGIGTVRTAYSLRDEDCREDLKYVNVPTGIFHGKKDIIVPYKLGAILHNELPSSELFTFEDSGHAVFYDELQSFNKCLIEYLK